ncbi:MAG: PEP-CTERM sorting domain-containing protein [Phycisphaerae bacterium]|jgi:hypothetical protein
MTRKQLIFAVCSAAVVLAIPSVVRADIHTLRPTPADLGDLDHGVYVTWGVDWSVPTGEEIIAATLAIENLNDWTVEDDDIIYMHLLDEALPGVHSWTDHQGGGDAFEGQGVLLTTFSDDDGSPNAPEDWSYSFTPAQIDALTDYAADGHFGLGFDPDCHYYNDGVSLTVQTASIPEPASMVLLAAGTLFVNRRR